ncbi:hypothetical protein DFH27DRAFT_643970 [Peziza echinospora]|nr:hypothetical protein DFH27DRAFT_643970 [Peziza echinospora]
MARDQGVPQTPLPRPHGVLLPPSPPPSSSSASSPHLQHLQNLQHLQHLQHPQHPRPQPHYPRAVPERLFPIRAPRARYPVNKMAVIPEFVHEKHEPPSPYSCKCNECALTAPARLDFLPPTPSHPPSINESSPSPKFYTPNQNSKEHLKCAALAYVKAMATRMFLTWATEGTGLAQHYTLSQLDNSSQIPALKAHTITPPNYMNINWVNIHTRFWVGPNPSSMSGIKEVANAAAMTVADAGMKLMLMGYPGSLESLNPHKFESVPTVISAPNYHESLATWTAESEPSPAPGPAKGHRRVYGVRIHDKGYNGENGHSRFSYFPDLNVDAQKELLRLRLPKEHVFLYGLVGSAPNSIAEYGTSEEAVVVKFWLEVVQQAYMHIAQEWLMEFNTYMDYNARITHYNEYIAYREVHPDELIDIPAPAIPQPYHIMENSFRILRLLQEVAVLNEMVIQVTKPKGTLQGYHQYMVLKERVRATIHASLEETQDPPSTGHARHHRERTRFVQMYGRELPSIWAGLVKGSAVYEEILKRTAEADGGVLQRMGWGLTGYHAKSLADIVGGPGQSQSLDEPAVTVHLEDLILKGAEAALDYVPRQKAVKRWPVVSSVQAMVHLKNHWHAK